MPSQPTHYLALEKQLAPITHVKHILSLTRWDAATMLASGSAPSRHREMASLSALHHELLTAPVIGELLAAAQQEAEALNQWQRANLRIVQKAYDEAKCIPVDLQRERHALGGECEFVWRTARQNNDFQLLAPHLERMFHLTRQVASIKADHTGKKPYDTLIDIYNPDFDTQSIDAIYAVLKAELPGLIHTIVDKQASEQVIPLTERVDKATQKAISLRMLQQMGFSLDHGRLDESAHPFCDGSNDDVRLTTRYDEANFLSGLSSTMHEAGHGLYQQNLPKAYRDQPVGRPKGLTFDESQSIIMERQAGTSRSFMEYLAALLQDEFSLKGPAYEAENLYKLMTRVQPSFIRVDADEVTYPLHVILRYEIEQAIIQGSIHAKDLPALWNEKMKTYLGITPDKDANGCMQDIHWQKGSIGYFPAYTNGAIIASMLMQAARKQHPTIDKTLGNGDFSTLNDFLTTHLRQFGSMKPSDQLLSGATGHAQVQPAIFINYLKKKYLG